MAATLAREDGVVNLLCFSDGGLRKSSGSAAAAWVAFAKCHGRWQMLAKSGQYFEKGICKSSFVAEAAGMDGAIRFAAQLVSEK